MEEILIMNNINQKTTTISSYLLQAVKNAGVNHVFGIPGDYVINFFSEIEKNDLKPVVTCTEQGAAFAADAYARLNGISALCVTYSVGGLNAVNAIAGAYAEKAPVIVISGAPGANEYSNDYLLHHSIKHSDSQMNMYKEVTVSQARLDDPHNAPFEINRVIKDCLDHKRPVYIEIPRDMVNTQCLAPGFEQKSAPSSDSAALEEALAESIELIKKAKSPVILGGVEIRRYGLEKEFTNLLEKSGYPYVTTILGKSIIYESHPQFAGVYMGKMGDPKVTDLIENSDCIIILGALMTDMNLGNAQLDRRKTIYATADNLSIKYHFYKDVQLCDFINKLTGSVEQYKKHANITRSELCEYSPKQNEPLTISRFFDRLNCFIPENTLVVCDVGDSMFGSVDLTIPKNSSYLAPAYYTSMGYAVPACLGAQVAKPESRPIVLVGDGAFQMTGMEVSTIANQGLNPIIFVINNNGYTTQRFLKDGAYNNIRDWKYHLLPVLLDCGEGLDVKTEEDLEKALVIAEKNTDSYTIVNLHFDRFDKSRTLDRLTSQFKKKVVQ